jgi:TRAP-type mannitol/chloroaromatic compound transport system permease small subunit
VSERPDVSEALRAGRRGDPGQPLPADMPRWMALAIDGIDGVNRWVGRIVCWLTVPLFSVMAYEIFMRYAFVAPTMWAYDLSRMLYGALFMLGAGYALSRGVHIRADFLYRLWSERAQGIVDLVLYLLLYFPGLIIFLYMAIDFATASWVRGERGMDTAWMPLLAPIKTVLPAGIALLLLQGVSETLKSYYAATRGRWPR